MERMKPRTLLIAAAAILLFAAAISWLRAGVTVIDKSSRLDGLVSAPFSKFNITGRAMTKESRLEMRRGMRRYIHVYREYSLAGVSLPGMAKALDESVKSTPFRTVRREYSSLKGQEELYYAIGFKGLDLLSMRFKESRRAARAQAAKKKRSSGPKVVVVLDDFGNNRENVETLLGIGVPITFSVLPRLRYTAAVADEAHAKGYEVILHLPLEPQRKDVKEEPDTINSRLPAFEAVSRLKADIASVPHLAGVSNHMGSRSTEEPALMDIIMAELKQKGLFFLDSLVTEQSVCGEAARKAGVRYARRGIFLDNDLNEDRIREQLYAFRDMAFKNGSCIAIGHDRKATVRVLKEVLPELEKEGLRFVTISELAR